MDNYEGEARRYGGENSAFMRQYLENLKQAKLSALFKSPEEELRIARGEAEDTKGLLNLRRELYKDLAKRNQITNIEDYRKAEELFSPIPMERKLFLDSIKPEYIFGTKDKRKNALLNYEKEIDDLDLTKKLVDYMSDKDHKEISDYKYKDETGEEKTIRGWELRERALEIALGKDTLEGKKIIDGINKYNPVINIEADMIMERATAQGLDKEKDKEKIRGLILDNEELIKRIQAELRDKSFEDIRKMSGDFFKNPAARQAIAGYDRSQEDFLRKLQEGRENELNRMYDPEEITSMLRGASQEMRRALKDLPGTVKGEKLSKEEEPRIITPPGVTTGRGEETQRSREEILRELGKIP